MSNKGKALFLVTAFVFIVFWIEQKQKQKMNSLPLCLDEDKKTFYFKRFHELHLSHSIKHKAISSYLF